VTVFSFLIVVVIAISYLSNKERDAKEKKKEEVRNKYEIEL
jgi:Na+-transporting methylmalonyl-CoA/oxaloacetate decarboxylase gamma subunit